MNYDFIRDASQAFRAYGQYADLCPARAMRPSNLNYPIWEYQVVYGARYLPAYYVEYYEMACLLASRLAGQWKSLNIASIGCGLCQDYYAISNALYGIAGFNYWGYDAVAWDAHRALPPPDNNFSYLNSSVKYFRSLNVRGIDVFVFPKSLSDLDFSCLTHLASVIASTDRRVLYFLNSYVRKNDEIYGSFNLIDQALSRANFKLNYQRGPMEVGNGRISDKYELFDSCVDKIECAKFDVQNSDCSQCEVVMHPIKSAGFSCYELREYVRS